MRGYELEPCGHAVCALAQTAVVLCDSVGGSAVAGFEDCDECVKWYARIFSSLEIRRAQQARESEAEAVAQCEINTD